MCQVNFPFKIIKSRVVQLSESMTIEATWPHMVHYFSIPMEDGRLNSSIFLLFFCFLFFIFFFFFSLSQTQPLSYISSWMPCGNKKRGFFFSLKKKNQYAGTRFEASCSIINLEEQLLKAQEHTSGYQCLCVSNSNYLFIVISNLQSFLNSILQNPLFLPFSLNFQLLIQSIYSFLLLYYKGNRAHSFSFSTDNQLNKQ